jgi:CHAT domain-containing protein
MKRLGCAWLFVLLMWPLPAAEHAAAESGLRQLKKDFSDIICSLLACYEQSRERHFLAMAVHFSDMRTHPLLDLAWGRSRQTMAAEQRLLGAAVRYRGQFLKGSCPDNDSEKNLCRQALDYIGAADRAQIPAPKVPLTLSDNCGIGRIQKNLTDRQVLLKYVLLEDRMLLFFISASEAGYEFLPVATGQAVAMINQLAEPLEDFASGRVDYLRIHFDMELAQRLYNVFLKRVAEHFPDRDELFIIPDQELFKLPFEALVMGFNKNAQQDDVLFSEYQAADYVIQKYTVSYYLSFADFLRNFAGRKNHPLSLAAFGQPLIAQAPANAQFPNQPNISTIAKIPSTRLEILNLEKMFAGSRRRIFLGANFNHDNFTRFAPQAKLIHIATHFFTNGRDPSRSAFLFSSPGADLYLCEARQILKLRLQAELVILSACETSEKNLLGLKSLNGMTAAFRQSGVRELITSLWPVDEFSSQIVPLFYREYLQGGAPAAALRNAKLALFGKTILIQGNARLSLAHPFLWANYVLVHFYH